MSNEKKPINKTAIIIAIIVVGVLLFIYFDRRAQEQKALNFINEQFDAFGKKKEDFERDFNKSREEFQKDFDKTQEEFNKRWNK